jgi:hypothetical protein
MTTVTYEDAPRPRLVIEAPRGPLGERLAGRVHKVVFHDKRPLAVERR